MKFLGLLVILVGAYLTDSAVQNRSPIDTIRELIKDPSDLAGTLARLKGKWTTLPTADAVPVGTGESTGQRTGENGRLPDSALRKLSWNGIKVAASAAPKLEALNLQYRARFGTNLPIGGGYRSFSQQVVTKATKGNLAATPGKSVHGWGLAIDLSNWRHGSDQDKWLRANGPKFGLFHPAWAEPGGSKPEPWHWEIN